MCLRVCAGVSYGEIEGLVSAKGWSCSRDDPGMVKDNASFAHLLT